MTWHTINTDDLTPDQHKLLKDRSYDITAESVRGHSHDLVTEATTQAAREMAQKLDRALWLAVGANYDYLHVRNRPTFSQAGDLDDYSIEYDVEPSDESEPPWETHSYVRTYDLRYWTLECLRSIAEEYDVDTEVHPLVDHHEREYP